METVRYKMQPSQPPDKLCFLSNSRATLKFFAELRGPTLRMGKLAGDNGREWVSYSGKKQKPSINRFCDYSKLHEISTSAALVLTAEYARAGRVTGSVPPTLNLGAWPMGLFNPLYEIGFFEIVGLNDETSERYSVRGSKKTLRIIEGSDAEKLAEAAVAIETLVSEQLDVDLSDKSIDLPLTNALSEAMINVQRHAYTAEHNFKYKHLGCWWVTASTDSEMRELRVAIYDQGATIPITFPQKQLSAVVMDTIRRNWHQEPEFEYQNDSVYILSAMKTGKSQTNKLHRGLGLPEMQELIDDCPVGSSLTVISRGGLYMYQNGTRGYRESFPFSVGGTLIEWVIKLE